MAPGHPVLGRMQTKQLVGRQQLNIRTVFMHTEFNGVDKAEDTSPKPKDCQKRSPLRSKRLPSGRNRFTCSSMKPRAAQ
ncbi:hypothetical protein CA13_01490 [Planctomycetes bacterium CA13]|uniref:Uncharacterized protein n=1 Tax=Novipirellula herctigrandis TaxID=2527986 RepID=A0A5C5YUN1_9BACT|nr:hypothetical protein CA13_01490 [Planctomycetes bacterium CA13]